ncbi:hypothetical protein JOF53_005889 [Crossiella equi]|uniref:Uncharacterized protein n=1 Tax=Crossiella equi TaxID=130796 RepID=A0ABS5AL78_9PSEU|nr:hypothetical protein [Crossiella equi]MBP2477017.1 hypothetical protein [Crossiella equi]
MPEPDFFDRLLARTAPGTGPGTGAVPVRPRLAQLFERAEPVVVDQELHVPPRVPGRAEPGPGPLAAAHTPAPPPAAPPSEAAPVTAPTRSAEPPGPASAVAGPVRVAALLPVRAAGEPRRTEIRSVNETITERRIPVAAAPHQGPAGGESPAPPVGPEASPRPGPRPRAAATQPRRRPRRAPDPQPVTVRIGRVEVTAAAPETPSPQRKPVTRAEPAVSLADHLGGDR